LVRVEKHFILPGNT